ncbi:MAG: proton-translocating transhydrogenase family protein [Mariprofundaceae bacterium]
MSDVVINQVTAGELVASHGAHASTTADPFIMSFSVFVLAIFIGYHVVWNVTPALHTPLMSVTNAISSIVIVGAIIASGPIEMNLPTVLGLVAVGLASVNIFGGFMVTQRMLAMFKKRS